MLITHFAIYKLYRRANAKLSGFYIFFPNTLSEGDHMEIKEAVILEASEQASKALRETLRHESCIVVVKNGAYAGIIDERSIANSTVDLNKVPCANICVKAPQLSPQAGVQDACKAFFGGHFKALPVTSEGKVQGVVSRKSVLEALKSDGYFSGRKVSDAMTSPVVSIDIASSVGQARAMLLKHNIRRLAVTSEGRVAGVLSMFDLAKPKVFGKQSPNMMQEKINTDLQPVSSFMQAQVETVEQENPLSIAAQKMLERGVSSLVVTDSSKVPVGMLSARDLFETVVAAKKEEKVFISGLTEEEKERYPEIFEECEAALGKLSKSAAVQYLSVHVKRTGAQYFVRARLVARRLFVANASDWKLNAAMSQLLGELVKMVRKEKPQKMHKRAKKEE